MNRRQFSTGLGATALAASSRRAKAAELPLKIGVLNDQSGVYADLSGPGSVEGARMAAEELGGSVLGRKIEIIPADHQNKPDIGATIARQWFDRDGVEAIADLANSAVAFAVQNLATERKKIILMSAASSDLTGKSCTPITTNWTFNSYSNGYKLASLLSNLGKKRWFIIVADYAFGHAFQSDIAKALAATGGQIIGSVRHPVGTSDFSSYLLSAQSSGADVIAFANSGSDLINVAKQAQEFGLGQKEVLATPAVFISDIHSLGLQAAKNLQFVDGFYWDFDDATRAFSKRYFARRSRMPTMTQAGMYSAVRNYLRAVAEAKTTDSTQVIAAMKSMNIDDAFTRHGRLRDDGQVVHDMYLTRVKTPEESKGPWDYCNIVSVIPAEDAFIPLAESACPLVKR